MVQELTQYEEAIEGAEDQNDLEFFALRQLEKMGLHLYRAENNQSEWKRLTLENDPSKPNGSKLGAPIDCE